MRGYTAIVTGGDDADTDNRTGLELISEPAQQVCETLGRLLAGLLKQCDDVAHDSIPPVVVLMPNDSPM
jgi:hypothetical protein